MALAAWGLAGALPVQGQEAHVVYQSALIGTLLQGEYDGATTIAKVRTHGDFGLGTVNGLDGEMIALEGVFYQIKSDGTVDILPDDRGTPFAQVMAFHPSLSATLPAFASLADLDHWIDAVIPAGALVAIRIHGSFSALETRSVPRQSRPYRPLAQVVDQQQFFHFSNVSGTLVGFRTPDYLRNIGIPGYHFHFLSDDRKAGGHVTGISSAVPMIAHMEVVQQLVLDLPSAANDHLADDMSAQLQKVERTK